MEWNTTFDGATHTDPRSELMSRALRAQKVGDLYVAVPVDLIITCLAIRECEARTVVNGNRFDKTLIEVKCTRFVNPETGKHEGTHVNGRNNWK